jgi:hypothetical protein
VPAAEAPPRLTRPDTSDVANETSQKEKTPTWRVTPALTASAAVARR